MLQAHLPFLINETGIKKSKIILTIFIWRKYEILFDCVHFGIIVD